MHFCQNIVLQLKLNFLIEDPSAVKGHDHSYTLMSGSITYIIILSQQLSLIRLVKIMTLEVVLLRDDRNKSNKIYLFFYFKNEIWASSV